MTKANKEGWKRDRDDATSKLIAKSKQVTAAAAATNATTAERIRDKLLRRLEAEIDALPAQIGTETIEDTSNYEYAADGKKGRLVKSRTDTGKRYKLRDLTGAYRDLMQDAPKSSDESTALQKAREILGGVQSAID